jgi:hypothetical protein
MSSGALVFPIEVAADVQNKSGLRRNSHGVLGSPALKSQPSAANAAQGGGSRTF